MRIPFYITLWAVIALLLPCPSQAQTHTNVLCGVDVAERNQFAELRGLKIGLITNHTGRNRKGISTLSLLHTSTNVQLAAIFSPEHGITGKRDETIGDDRDSESGVIIHSLYGETKRPSPESLRDLDALVFDIQDIGARFYTYISTLCYCLEAASSAGKKFYVLDRPNAINGLDMDGPLTEGEFTFTACHSLPIRHGMTVGELALMFNQERHLKVDLHIIKMEGWQRSMWLDETGLPWINPSPNMRSMNAAALYPGLCILETTALSVGRGTETPFEILGAPYIDKDKFSQFLNDAHIPGVAFEAITFTPQSSKFVGQTCQGVRCKLLDRNTCPVLDIGCLIAEYLHQNHPKDFDLKKANTLLAHSPTVTLLQQGKSMTEIRASWQHQLESFRQRRAEFLLYP